MADPEIPDDGPDASSAGDDPSAGPGAAKNGEGGLRWSFEFDLGAALAAIGRTLDGGDEADQEEVLAQLEAMDREAADAAEAAGGADTAGGADSDGSSPAGEPVQAGTDLSGLIAENLPTGPGLAAWLSQHDADRLADRDLPGVAAAFRRVASWAQAAELATVAEMAVRSAARDDETGLARDGRPAAVTRDAAGQVSLGLAISPTTASWWTEFAITLRWRLRRTWAALDDGTIDQYRARIIAELTAPLTDEAARAVESRILGQAGDMTYSRLRAAVRRAVIAADPEGAEHRRQAAERQARVTLCPDQDHTAFLGGSKLPAVQATAAMARISAMARAMKAAGAGGGIDLLRAQVFLGILLGTLPTIPPPADGPPDSEPPPDDDPPPHARPPHSRSADGQPPHGQPPDSRTRDGRPRDGRSRDDAASPGGVPPQHVRPPGGAPPEDGRPPRRGPADPSHGPPRSRTGPHTSTGRPDSPDPPNGTRPPYDSSPPGSSGSPAATGPPSDTGPPGHIGPPRDTAPSDKASPPRNIWPPGTTGPPDSTRPPADIRRPDDTRPPDSARPPDHTGPPDSARPSVSTLPPGDTRPPDGIGAPGRTGRPDDTGPPGDGGVSGDAAPWAGVPMPTDVDAPEDDGVQDTPMLPDHDDYVDCWSHGEDPLDDHVAGRGTEPAWPIVPPAVTLPPGAARPSAVSADDATAAARGMLDLTLPWSTLTGESSGPGALGRIGPVTAAQARQLARVAAVGDFAARWRVIITDRDGRATAVARIRPLGDAPDLEREPDPQHDPGSPARLWRGAGLSSPAGGLAGMPTTGGGMPVMAGVVGRVTVTIPEATVADTRSWDIDSGGILAAVLESARSAADRSGQLARANRDAGGCAHVGASRAYRPPPRMREYVTARDMTCRVPFCGQPAWRGDLDHTHAWHKGGRTCACNLGPLCRAHHILKQLLGWELTQLRPGIFQWTTPAGRTYLVGPDSQPV